MALLKRKYGTICWEGSSFRDNAEAVGNFTVFNIKGNRYRLILDINYEEQVAYFKYFLTHAEYDKEQWKNDSYY
jgi:mRNA interferase HigB